MGLEAAGYITDIDPTWPLGTDNVSQGDDHLRNFKKSVQDSFPNISGPVTATQDDLNAGGTPTGSMVAYGGATPPDKWLLCDGAAVDRVSYADLYIAIGDAYGAGDGSTTFNLPDMQDKVAGGVGIVNELADESGNDIVTELLAHTHTTNSTGAHTHDQLWRLATAQSGSGKAVYDESAPRTENAPTESAGAHSHTVNSTGTSEPNNRQATLYFNYIIKT